MTTPHLRAILIDDEERARNSLQTLLEGYCEGVEVVGLAANVPDGVLLINRLRPNLVFLDIEMPDYNGFELLGFFREVDFDLIFVTAYSEFALRAFEVSAVDYLLKPVEISHLQGAIEKARRKRDLSFAKEKMELLHEAFSGGDLRKLALPVQDGLLFVEVESIQMLEADGAYTKVFLQNGTQMLVSKKMRFFEENLETRPNFFRVHRSYLVNLNSIRRYIRGDSLIQMDNGVSVPIARDKKQEFESHLRELKMTI